jgi:hypothetical protein
LSQKNSRALVPPRPNLGPEPWSETRQGGSQLPWLGIGAAILAALLLGLLLLRRRSQRRRARPIKSPTIVLDPTPETQLVQLASEVRETLIQRFGPSLRARTTEEIAGDQAIKKALGDPQFEDLIRFLATADHWKFAPAPENGDRGPLVDDLARWTAWHQTSLARR